MLQHLASIYVNLNKVRDVWYSYNKLVMKAGQPFGEFQTTFLYLAGEGQISTDNLWLDLFDKLTTQLQNCLASTLADLDIYKKLAERCLSLDTELKRIATRVDCQNQYKGLKGSQDVTVQKSTPGTFPGSHMSVFAQPAFITALESNRQASPSTPISVLMCFNCRQARHLSKDCRQSKCTAELKDIEEEVIEEDTEKEEPGKEDV
jgi:hypothetical protein